MLLVLTLAVVAYVRLRLADLPLERDEGEYAYAGQLILDGVPPYQLAYNMKFPGTYYAYAAQMMLFGQSPTGIRLGLLVVNLATALVVFLVGRRLAGTLAGAIGASAFSLLSVDRWCLGVFAHATHYVALPVAAGILAFLSGMQSGRALPFLTVGALAGIATVMKQHAAPFAVMAILLAAWSALETGNNRWREMLRRAGLVTIGLLLVLTALVGLLAIQGVLDRFWFWTYSYAGAYISQVPLSEAGAAFIFAWGYLTQSTAWLWYAGLTGLALLFVSRWPGQTRVVLVAWLVSAAAAIAPGFYFREHYFIVAMPVAGLLVGIAVASIDRGLARLMTAWAAQLTAVAIFAGIAGAYLLHERRYLFSTGPIETMRLIYGTNPFPESVEIARYLNAHTGPDDRIVVLGSEPQIYFYAQRKSATGYIYAYPLTENQPYAGRMQDEYRREIEAARPRYLVVVAVPVSWGPTAQAGTSLMTWVQEYTTRCYEMTGVADINPAGDSIFRWDADARQYQPRHRAQVWTLRRKDAVGCN